jgi:hypothetical protein
MPLDQILKALDRAADYWGVDGELGLALVTLPLDDETDEDEFLDA